MLEARSEMLQLFWDTWEPGIMAEFPTDFQAVLDHTAWPDVPPQAPIPPQTATPWARVSIAHASGGQDSLRGAAGRSRFERQGVLTVQCFAPVGESATRVYNMAQIAMNAFDGKATPGGVWFRNARPNEAINDGWKQVNVLAEFLYDEIK